MIYMQHPDHGAMHVLSESEAVTAEKNGWQRAEWPPKPKTEQAPGQAVAERKKPGPKPKTEQAQ